jgi:hypothetical protein
MAVSQEGVRGAADCRAVSVARGSGLALKGLGGPAHVPLIRQADWLHSDRLPQTGVVRGWDRAQACWGSSTHRKAY